MCRTIECWHCNNTPHRTYRLLTPFNKTRKTIADHLVMCFATICSMYKYKTSILCSYMVCINYSRIYQNCKNFMFLMCASYAYAMIWYKNICASIKRFYFPLQLQHTFTYTVQCTHAIRLHFGSFIWQWCQFFVVVWPGNIYLFSQRCASQIILDETNILKLI